MKTIREGQKVWPYCGTCGCRLDIKYDDKYTDMFWATHFEGIFEDQDARGCRRSCVRGMWFINLEEAEYYLNA